MKHPRGRFVPSRSHETGILQGARAVWMRRGAPCRAYRAQVVTAARAKMAAQAAGLLR